MQQNKYEIRSKDVQEIMKSPPKRLLLLGNLVVVFVLSSFLILANNFKLPIKTILPCKILKIDSFAFGNKFLVELYVDISIPNNIDSNQNVVVKINDLLTSNYDNINAKILYVNHTLNIIKCIIIADNHIVLSNAGKILFLIKDMRGIIEANTESVSVLKIFFSRMMKNITRIT
jgi:hypothetical protein